MLELERFFRQLVRNIIFTLVVSDYCMELEQGTLRGRHGNQGISDRYGDLEKN